MRYILVFVALFFFLQANSQQQAAASLADRFNLQKEEIRPYKKGDIIPDVLFVSKENFPGNVRSMHDFKGKLVLLDFWSTGCPTCIEAFPKMDRLQKKYGDRLQIILINPWETTDKISQRWGNRRPGQVVNYPDLPRVNGDSIWRLLFPASSVPHHVWLNQAGKVLAVTSGHNANESNIDALLSGKEIHMLLKPANERGDFSRRSFIEKVSNGLIRPGLGANFYDYYEGEDAGIYGWEAVDVIDTAANTIRSSYINQSPLLMAKKLFRQLGKSEKVKEFLFNDRVFMETTNRSVFIDKVPNEIFDEWSSRVKFCMEVVLPLEKKDSMYLYMFDQFRSFIKEKHQLNIAIEERVKPCLVLIQKSGTNRLKTKGGEPDKIFSKKDGNNDMVYSNTAFESVFYDLEYQINGNADERYTVVNEVPFKGKVDMEFPHIYGQRHRLPELKKALNNYGLDLIEADRKVKVFVVRDL